MSNFFALNTALSGLRAAQVGLETASHNVANANTKGYTRQRVDLATSAPYRSAVGPLGTGVDVKGLSRARDAFLDARARASMASFNAADTRASLLQRTEAVLGEPDNGLTGLVNEVWASFEDLSMDPADHASRRQVLASLETFAARVRTIAGQWDVLADDTSARLTDNLAEANGALDRLAQLNRILPAAGARGAPNDLLNERDLLLDKLSGLLGVSVRTAADGTATVSLGGLPLVEPGAETAALHLAADGTVRAGGDQGPTVRTGGECAALQRFVDTDLPEQRARLTEFATAFADMLNSEHARGFARTAGPPAGSAAGEPLLGFDAALGDGLAGFTMVLSSPDGLASADVAGPDGGPPAPNDGANAARIAGLRIRASDGGAPLDQRLRDLVVGLGRQVASATREADAQESLAASVEMARLGAHGVSLDEEMVSVVQYQRALEASSRVMSAGRESLSCGSPAR